YVCPVIYYTVDSGEVGDDGKVRFNFHVKCAFQSRAFVRESTKEQHSVDVLTHEQDHYDISLTYVRLLQNALSKGFDEKNYAEEIEKAANDILDRHEKIQKQYDAEANPNGKDDTIKQHLWDKRIKKCLENNTDEYYMESDNVLQYEGFPGTVVK